MPPYSVGVEGGDSYADDHRKPSFPFSRDPSNRPPTSSAASFGAPPLPSLAGFASGESRIRTASAVSRNMHRSGSGGIGGSSSAAALRYKNPRPIFIPKRPWTAGGTGGGGGGGAPLRPGTAGGGGGGSEEEDTFGEDEGFDEEGRSPSRGGGANTAAPNGFNSQFRNSADALASLRHMLAPGIGIPPPPIVPPRFYPKRWPSRPPTPSSEVGGGGGKSPEEEARAGNPDYNNGYDSSRPYTGTRGRALEKIADHSNGSPSRNTFAAPLSSAATVVGGVVSAYSDLNSHFARLSGCPSAAMSKDFYFIHIRIDPPVNGNIGGNAAPSLSAAAAARSLRDWLFSVVITDVTPIAVEVSRETRWGAIAAAEAEAEAEAEAAAAEGNVSNGGIALDTRGRPISAVQTIDGKGSRNSKSIRYLQQQQNRSRPSSSSSASASLINSGARVGGPSSLLAGRGITRYPATIPSSTTQVNLLLAKGAEGLEGDGGADVLPSAAAAGSGAGGSSGGVVTTAFAANEAANYRAALGGVSLLQSRPLSSSGRPTGIGMATNPYGAAYATTSSRSSAVGGAIHLQPTAHSLMRKRRPASAAASTVSSAGIGGGDDVGEDGPAPVADSEQSADQQQQQSFTAVTPPSQEGYPPLPQQHTTAPSASSHHREVNVYRHTISGVRADANRYLVFHPPYGSTLSPCGDIPWVPCPSYLYGRSLRIEVFATRPTRTKVVDTTVSYGED